MRVIVHEAVYQAVDEFYAAAIKKHPTLDMATVLKKEDRMYKALQSLGNTYYLYRESRHIVEWKRKGYLDFIYEEFHFAFHVVVLPSGEMVVAVEDARHSLLFHD